jgi:putative sterol carrier protein
VEFEEVIIMDVMELSKRIVDEANKDEDLLEKIKDTQTTIVMQLTDAQDPYMTFSIENGTMRFSQEKPEQIDFMFEISTDDYRDMITGKKAGMILIATKKLKMVKGSMSEIGKIVSPLGAVPKLGKKIVEEG